MKRTPPALPTKDGDAHLHELTRDQLSVLLYASLTDRELAGLVKEMRITLPGFRMERLSPAERADVLAEEIIAAPKDRKHVLEVFRKAYDFPALLGVSFDEVVAKEFAAIAVEDDGAVRLLWRLLADPAEAVRKAAGPALDRWVERFYGPPPGEDGEAAEGPEDGGADPATRETAGRPAGPAAPSDAGREIARYRKLAERAQEDVANLKNRERELKDQLKTALAAASEQAKLTSAARAAREEADRRREAAEVELRAARAKGTGKEAKAQRDKLAATESRAREAERERQALLDEVAGLRERVRAAEAKHATASAASAASAPAGDEAPVEELPSTWSLPRFTREFYDSLSGWDPRIQRAAVKQAILLAENHRHPSLRAIPLEGLPGYFRVRVATDVRLIYRRADRDVEILSVIDREDLDRYVRQAKTR